MKEWLFDGMEDGWCRANAIVGVAFIIGMILLGGFVEKM